MKGIYRLVNEKKIDICIKIDTFVCSFGGNRPRPYGPPGRGGYDGPPGRGGYDRNPYTPMPPAAAYDRYDPYYRYYMEREAYYSRMGSLGDRAGPAPRDSRMPAMMPRERLPERYAPDPRSYLDDRTRSLPTDPYFRERDPLPRPPPEYYERYYMCTRQLLFTRQNIVCNMTLATTLGLCLFLPPSSFSSHALAHTHYSCISGASCVVWCFN